MDFDELDEAPGGRPYDIVIYGATGYSGCLMVEHLDALLSEEGAVPHTWAVAGRNRKKLDKIAANCRSSPGVIEVTDRPGLDLMAEVASVVVNAAGPYIVCGTDVVSACVEKRTHYVDIAGELIWMKRMIKAHHKRAQEDGVMIVNCAGVMCAPEDLCCHMLVERLGPLSRFRLYQMEIGVGGGGGTFFSGYAGYEEMFDHELEVLTNPFSLGGGRKCGRRREDEDPAEAAEDGIFPGVWTSGGHATPCAQRVLRRSCGLFEDAGGSGGSLSYGDNIVFEARYCFMQEGLAKQRAQTTKEPRDVQGLIKHAKTMKEAVQRGQFAPPGGGPTRAARAEGGMEGFALAEGESGEWAHVHYRGPDCFEVTAMTAVTGALVMVEEAEEIRIKERGGVLTPAYAFHGSTYAKRLSAAPFAGVKGRSVSFELGGGKPKQDLVEKAVKACDKKSSDIFQRQMKGSIPGCWEPPELLK